MKTFSTVSALALALAAAPAFAADLPSTKGAPAFVAPLAPAFSWTGLYAGVNIGYGFNAGGNATGSLFSPLATPSVSVWSLGQNLEGVTGGGQIGYNYQVNPWLVVGLEADFQGSDINSSSSAFVKGFFLGDVTGISSTSSLNWWGTVRGRVGVTLPSVPNVLVYGTGGFAYGEVDKSVSVVNFPIPPAGSSQFGRSAFSQTATGWTAGGGVEWAPAAFPGWSVKVEYLYTDLGATNQSFGSSAIGVGVPFVAAHASPTQFHTVRAGLNYRLNLFGAASAPVIAKY
ncbi:outer membrane protein [Methylosinus sp. PW1]|uniref:outer membrane protein n=1 Tax=Methylosinus sp. PW1 TaxID=107636 RepID=UPI00055E2A3E|nr:outer membrane beta-barrel protein [Methylosinus sp. PW1]